MSMENGHRFQAALAAIDAANAEDPTQEMEGGVAMPAALLYGRRMSRWLLTLAPDASEALRLAVRAQHLGRWRVPRAEYSSGRSGYLRWRTDSARLHAEEAAAILRPLGYDEAFIARVSALIRKQGLKRDAEAQCLEDAACLVFLEHRFKDFVKDHTEEKVITVLASTWAKMSVTGRLHAMKLAATLPAAEQALIDRALNPGRPDPGRPDPDRAGAEARP